MKFITTVLDREISQIVLLRHIYHALLLLISLFMTSNNKDKTNVKTIQVSTIYMYISIYPDACTYLYKRYVLIGVNGRNVLMGVWRHFWSITNLRFLKDSGVLNSHSHVLQ